MWFTEDPWPPMLICGLAGLLAAAWFVSSRRLLAIGVAVLLFAAGAAIYFVELAIVTPAEEVEQLTVQLCHDFQQQKPQVLEAFSPSRPELRNQCAAALMLVKVDPDLRVTDLTSRVTNAGSRGVCRFRANATISLMGHGSVGHQPARFEITWAREPEGWKIIEVQRLHVLRDEPLPLLQPTSGQ